MQNPFKARIVGKNLIVPHKSILDFRSDYHGFRTAGLKESEWDTNRIHIYGWVLAYDKNLLTVSTSEAKPDIWENHPVREIQWNTNTRQDTLWGDLKSAAAIAYNKVEDEVKKKIVQHKNGRGPLFERDLISLSDGGFEKVEVGERYLFEIHTADSDRKDRNTAHKFLSSISPSAPDDRWFSYQDWKDDQARAAFCRGAALFLVIVTILAYLYSTR